ncbi:hypothetical protein ACFW9F_30195 [Streptomyces sp. NPDC059506]|uniref:hypothetical protein n=1 Tax=Streptomyces sp. NPDC059506 TaxID=3347751 RepID=UPI0036A85ACC
MPEGTSVPMLGLLLAALLLFLDLLVPRKYRLPELCIAGLLAAVGMLNVLMAATLPTAPTEPWRVVFHAAIAILHFAGALCIYRRLRRDSARPGGPAAADTTAPQHGQDTGNRTQKQASSR